MWTGIRNLWRTATFRLALLFALAITIAMSLVLVLTCWQIVLRDTARLNNILVAEVAKAIDQPQSRLMREIDLRLTGDLRRLDFAAIFDPNGELVSGNLNTLPLQLPIDGAAHVLPLPAAGHKNAIEPASLVAQWRPDGGVLLLGRNLYDVYAFRKIVIESLALGIAPAIVLALIIGTLFSLRAARRLKTINQQIMRIMQGDLNERLPTHGSRDDLDHVAGGVNLMLDEIVRLLDQIKSVGDNIAHDLRTPLAVMRARLDRGLESGSAEDLRGAADLALVDLDRALTTVTALLRISDIEYGRRTSSFDEVDLKDVCVNAFELFQPLAEAKSIAFTLDAPAPLRIVGDFDLLVEAVGNLIDNAIKFTPAGGSVKIVATMAASQPAVRVCDSGPGVAPFERSSIFKRFYRSAQTRHLPGTGLGLNMAATIARLHGFDLRVVDNHPGAVFELSPLARPAPSPSGAKQTDQADWSSKIAGEQIRIEV
jgi:signal transduction histidine kinase